jgi:hypothetical protein
MVSLAGERRAAAAGDEESVSVAAASISAEVLGGWEGTVEEDKTSGGRLVWDTACGPPPRR